MVNCIFKFRTRIWYCCACKTNSKYLTPCICIGDSCPDSCIYYLKVYEPNWKQLTTIKTLYKLIKSFKGLIMW